MGLGRAQAAESPWRESQNQTRRPLLDSRLVSSSSAVRKSRRTSGFEFGISNARTTNESNPSNRSLGAFPIPIFLLRFGSYSKAIDRLIDRVRDPRAPSSFTSSTIIRMYIIIIIIYSCTRTRTWSYRRTNNCRSSTLRNSPPRFSLRRLNRAKPNEPNSYLHVFSSLVENCDTRPVCRISLESRASSIGFFLCSTYLLRKSIVSFASRVFTSGYYEYTHVLANRKYEYQIYE